MKKRILIYALALIVLCGCAQDKSDSDKSSHKKNVKAATQKDEDIEEDKKTSKAGMPSNIVLPSDESNSSDEEHAVTAAEDSNESLKAYLVEMKASHNQNPLNLTPRVGEFATWSDDEMELIDNPDSETYGFWQDITPGCSVWCAVNGYNVDVEASSTLEPQGKHSYDAENILDGSRNDAWVEGVAGDGIGEKISITKSYDTASGALVPEEESVFYSELCIVNGLARTEKVWKENGRVKSLKFYYNDEYLGNIELEDTMKPQFISLSGLNLAARNNEKNTFSFEIADVYPGDKYEDTAITGIEIAFDSPNH